MRRKLLIVAAGFFALLLVALVVAWAVLARYDYNALKPKIQEAVLAATGRELLISGDIKLHLGLRPRLTVDGVSFANASWGSKPDMARVKSMALSVSLVPLLSKQLNIRELTLIEPDILLETDGNGKANFDFSEGPQQAQVKEKEGSGGDFLENLRLRGMRLERANITFQDGTSKQAYHLFLDDVRAKSDGGIISWDIRGTYNGEAFRLTAETGPLAGLMQREKPFPIKAKVDFAGVAASLKGSVTGIFQEPKMEFAIAASGKDLAGINRVAGTDVSLPGPFSLSATLANKGPKAYEIGHLSLQVAESDLSGSLAVDLSGKRPSLQGELSSESMDLRPLAGTTKKKPGRSPKKKLFPDSPLPVSGLQKLDADLSYRAKVLRLPQLVFRDMSVKLAVKDGGLRIPELSGSLFGGTFNAGLALAPEAKGVRSELTLEVKRMDLAAMLRDLGSQGTLSGTLDFSADLSARGDSVAALMGGLNGITVLTGDHASIGSKYMGLLGADFANSLLRLLNPFKKSPDVSAVNCLVSGFSIKDGKARTTAMLLDLPENLVVGEGEVDLASETIDMSIKSIPKEGLGTSGMGKITMNLGKLAEPFKLSGTLSNPTLGVDASETAYLVGKSLGGMALFGPVGILSALLGTSHEGKNPCRVAEKAARKGAASLEEKKGIIEKSAGAVERGLKSFGHSIGNLFGK